MWLHVQYGCGFVFVRPLFVPADMIHSIVRAGLAAASQSGGTKRGSSPVGRGCCCPVLLLAGTRHLHHTFNCGWHCLKTRREKATHRFYGEAHTHYLKKKRSFFFYCTETFPSRRGFICYGAEMRSDTHTASGEKKNPDTLNTSLT